MRTTDNDTPMIKMLVPHRHAGALIGKGGENMKRLETDSGARIKLSQSSEFYPETGERVLSARGDVNQVQCAVEMVLQSLEASGRGNQEEGAEMPAQQVRLIIPERAAGSLIGKGGENIRRLQEDSSSRVSVSGKVRLFWTFVGQDAALSVPPCDEKSAGRVSHCPSTPLLHVYTHAQPTHPTLPLLSDLLPPTHHPSISKFVSSFHADLLPRWDLHAAEIAAPSPSLDTRHTILAPLSAGFSLFSPSLFLQLPARRISRTPPLKCSMSVLSRSLTAFGRSPTRACPRC